MNEELIYSQIEYLESLYEQDADNYAEEKRRVYRVCEEDLGLKTTIQIFRGVQEKDWRSAKEVLEGDIEP